MKTSIKKSTILRPALRTAALALAAVAAAQQVPSVRACTTCNWSASDGYYCGGSGPYDSCTISSPSVPCELQWTGAC
jgi:hypothetical protein